MVVKTVIDARSSLTAGACRCCKAPAIWPRSRWTSNAVGSHFRPAVPGAAGPRPAGWIRHRYFCPPRTDCRVAATDFTALIERGTGPQPHPVAACGLFAAEYQNGPLKAKGQGGR